jgi:HD-GYP domain-containing protein (c-di-GMP phosphodiesterase class II)
MPLNRAPDGAKLGKDVASGRADGMPLLRAGTALTPRFKNALVRAGVHAVYIDDEQSRGIDPQPVLSDETRAAATAAVSRAFDGAQDALKTGRPLSNEAIEELQGIAARMADEIGQTNEFALALADLSAADSYTLQHSVDVAALGLLIGQRLFNTRGYFDYRGRRTYDRIDQRLTRLGLGLLLHDIGKLAVPSEILNKPGKLDPAEWAIIKRHPVDGQEMLDRSGGVLADVGLIVRGHHERWDGGGYPDGLVAEAIPLAARIICACDAYSAMTTNRPYRAAMPVEEAIAELRNCSGTQFDPQVIEAVECVVRREDRTPKISSLLAA